MYACERGWVYMYMCVCVRERGEDLLRAGEGIGVDLLIHQTTDSEREITNKVIILTITVPIVTLHLDRSIVIPVTQAL